MERFAVRQICDVVLAAYFRIDPMNSGKLKIE